MKKKVLTTAMALAMLAPTATTFASTTTVGGPQSQQQTSNLDITGTVNNSTGQAPEGQISVTLPTTVSFVIDEDYKFLTASTMQIENKSQNVDIAVSVSAFTDKTPTSGEGITFLDDSMFVATEYDRSFANARLFATGGTNGSQVELLSSGFEEQSLVNLGAGMSTGLSLVGQVGEGDYDTIDDSSKKNNVDIDEKGTNDQFTLTFKIAKQ